MANEESKFDTMHLIADAASTDDYSVEDILEEFSPAEPAEQVLSEETEISQETQAEPEPPAPLEEPVRLSEAELAEEIAEAIAASIPPEPQEETEPPEPDAPISDTPEPPQPEPAAPQPSHAAPKNETRETSTTAKKRGKKQDKGDGQELGGPPPKQKKIRRSKVRSQGAAAASLGLLISDIRARQQASLPAAKTSLKAAEKSKALLARIGSVLMPVRYIVLLLMVFALAGRRFSWMLLGFLGGKSGMTVAMVFTLLAMAAAWQSVVRAIRDAMYLRFSQEILLLVTTVLSFADTAINQNEATLLPLLAIAWCVTGTAAQMSTRAELLSLRTMIRGQDRTAVRTAGNRFEHKDCIGKAPAGTSGFVRHLEEPDTWHSGWGAASGLILMLAVISSAYVAAKTEGNYLSVLTALLAVATPVSLALCCARPYELLARILSGSGAVAGWYGIRRLSGRKAVLIYDGDVFPRGTVSHQGVKVYGRQTPRLLASYAASLVLRADNGLGDVFMQLLREMDGELCDVNYFQSSEGGLMGRIHNIRVMVGTYQFMQLMGATPPSGAPRSGTYIALNETVAGVFAIRYRVKPGAVSGFRRLMRDRSLTVLIATRNFCINPAFMERWFHTPVSGITCPKSETRRALSQPSQFSKGPVCGYVVRDGISPYGRLVSGGRRIYRMGMIFTALSVGFSLFLLLRTAMTLSGGGAVPGGALLLYQLLLFAAVEISARFAVR